MMPTIDVGNPGPADVGVRRALRDVRPLTRGQLHAWLRAVLGMGMPAQGRIDGHDSPFEYLCHAFFEEPRAQRNALVWAARGAGKTLAGAVATLLDMLFKPGIEICILGGSFAQSSRMHAHLRRMLEDEALVDLVLGNITLTHVELVNGSRVEVLSQSQTAVRGRRAHRLRCDEVELFEPDVWEAAQMITRSGRCGEIDVRAGVDALSTLHRPFGLMSRLVRDAHATNTRVLRWSAIDVLEHCPAHRACESCGLFDEADGGCHGRAKIGGGFFHIDDALDQRARISLPAWRSEMLCQRPDVSDCVYPEFDEATHVFGDDAPPAGDDASIWLGGIDFGYHAPTALLLATLDGAGTLHVMDEIIERGCRTSRMIERARALCATHAISHAKLRWIGADPAGLQRSDQSGVSTIALWRRAGFRVRHRSTSIEAGVEAVRARLAPADGRIGVRVHRRCAGLIRALREYHYPSDRRDDLPPVKDGPDHACDALRYLIVNLDLGAAGVLVTGY